MKRHASPKHKPMCPDCQRIANMIRYQNEQIDKVIEHLRRAKGELARPYFGGARYSLSLALTDLKQVVAEVVKLDEDEQAARNRPRATQAPNSPSKET
jgi:hypothetical protein